ncbi:TPA: QVPTGV class sortase B protein-sorting domain-containing protein [Streptococcus suis]|nr:QVPTGV class sortase B protein-sorting domain-containing protein [Streptococcus suis]HEM5682931.1 QVPTGV class sortase B protein-sorting domain-containing protein [Streptococcus suis]
MKKYSFLVSGLALMMLATGTVKAETASQMTEGVLSIEKVVNIGESLMPNAEFTFDVESVNVAGETKDNLAVYSGIVEGIEKTSASYTNGDKTESKNASINFNGVKFSNVGIYRYKVTEKQGMVPGVTYDKTSYIIDVYVVKNEQESLVPKYIVSYQENQKEKKPVQFNNQLKTTSLTVKKSVTGNAGDKNKDFGFTITLKADQFYKESEKISAKLVDKGGSITERQLLVGVNKFTLKDGESLSIDKLPIGITYKVEENKLEDYKVSAELTENNQAKTYNFTEQISDETPDTIVVTNNKNINTPTGVAMAIAPYAVMTLVGIGGVLYFVKNKKA